MTTHNADESGIREAPAEDELIRRRLEVKLKVDGVAITWVPPGPAEHGTSRFVVQLTGRGEEEVIGDIKHIIDRERATAVELSVRSSTHHDTYDLRVDC
jgi:hypothetical protein